MQAIIDGPTTSVPRQSFPYKHSTLTPLTVSKLPRGAGSGVVRKRVEADKITGSREERTGGKRTETKNNACGDRPETAGGR